MRSSVASIAIGSITASPLVRNTTRVADAGLLRLLVDRVGEPPQRGGQGLLVERRGSELADEPARLAEVLGGRLAREAQLLAGALVVDVALGGVQQHLDARQPLRDRVVDLACEALALGERPGLATRGGELLARGEQVEDERLPVAASPATWPGSPSPMTIATPALMSGPRIVPTSNPRWLAVPHTDSPNVIDDERHRDGRREHVQLEEEEGEREERGIRGQERHRHPQAEQGHQPHHARPRGEVPVRGGDARAVPGEEGHREDRDRHLGRARRRAARARRRRA